MRASLLVLMTCLFTAALPAAAQGRAITVSGARPLTFGTVLPGLPRTILRTDAANSGEFDLKGEKFGPVQLVFILPASMLGPLGATMPLWFGTGDAGYSASGAIGGQIGFDPKLPFVATLSNNGKGSVFLGGTANPSAGQRSGSYSGTVTLSVAYVGL